MENTILDAALSQGIWAVLAVFLLLYVIRENEKCEEKQEERENKYQNILLELADKLITIDRIEEKIVEIRDIISGSEQNKM